MLRHDNAVILIQIEHSVFAAKFASKNAIQKSAFFGRILFAIAFNIKKMCSKTAKQTKNGGNKPHSGLFLLIYRLGSPENRIFFEKHRKSVA